MKNRLKHKDRAIKSLLGDRKGSELEVKTLSFTPKIDFILYTSSFILYMTV
ncbi:hypothetical protein AB0758_31405 [Tolypothrix bouteillei VB521301_2]